MKDLFKYIRLFIAKCIGTDKVPRTFHTKQKGVAAKLTGEYL